MMEHPDEKTLIRFVTGQMSEDAEERMEEHLAVCEMCCQRLDEVEREANAHPFLSEIKQAMCHIQATEPHVDSELNNLYRLEEKIGSGGMGVVWKAHDKQANRSVVVKFIQSNVLRAKESMEILHKTFLKVHTFQHSNICPLYGLFDDPEYGPYLVMKFIEGQTLAMYRRQHPFMTVSDVVEILRYVARALDYAHGYKVIHRDIKPQNIMIGNRTYQTDNIQVIDFELADAILDSTSSEDIQSSSRVAGTRAYMAPEQWRGHCDIQTDQYALAVTAYELLSGRVPFTCKTLDTLCPAVLNDPPAPIEGLSKEINAVLFKGLSKDPLERYESCSEFVKALANSGHIAEYHSISSSFPDIPGIRIPKGSPKIAKSRKTQNSTMFLFFAGMVCFFLFAVISILVVMNMYPVAKELLTKKSPLASPSHTEQPLESPKKSAETPSVPPPPKTSSSLSTGQISSGEGAVPAQKGVKQKSFPRRSELFPTIRYCVNIDEVGIVSIFITSSYSVAPPIAFDGTPIPFSAQLLLNGGMAFRGNTSGVGRLIFPLGVGGGNRMRLPGQPHVDLRTPGPIDLTYGWTSRLEGCVWNPKWQTSRFSEGASGVEPGLIIGKAQKLPSILVFDVVDDPSCHPPTLIIELKLQEKFHSGQNRVAIHCFGSRKDAQTILFSGFVHSVNHSNSSWLSGPVNQTGFTNVELKKNNSIAKKLVIPSEFLRVGQNKSYPWLLSYQLQVRPGGFSSSSNYGHFDLALFDMIGFFEPHLGIPRPDPVNPMPMAQFQRMLQLLISLGSQDKLISINGASDWNGICESMKSLKFGDEITLKVKRGKNYHGPNSDLKLYAQ